MSLVIAYITAFDGLTIHNGTTHFAERVVEQTSLAPVRYVTLANGALYDMDGSSTATELPQAFSSNVTLLASSAANLHTAVAAIAAKIGVRGTLTGTYLNTTGTVTCTARLEQIENLRSDVQQAHTMTRLRLAWRPLTNWS